MLSQIANILAIAQNSAKYLSRLLAWVVAIALAWNALSLFHMEAWAATSTSSNLQAQLISEVKTIQPNTPFWVALHLKIRPGWHVYWKNPGDSGAAPIVQWTLPNGFRAGELVYPYPERLPAGPLMNFGYKDEVYYLTEISPAAGRVADRPVTLRAKADLLVCEVECIPEQKTLTLTLPVATNLPAPNPTSVEVFASTRQALPQPSPWKTSFTLNKQYLTLYVNAPGLQAGQVEDVQFFPSQDGVIQNASPQTLTVGKDGITLKTERGYQETLNVVEGVLVVREKLDNQTTTQAFTVQAKPRNPSESSFEAESTAPIWQTLLFALAGGIILNLMPCVFPVLSLKVLTVAQQAQQSPRQARSSGLVFTAGVLVSFALVAGVLLILRGLGQQIGWGFQLQSPVFVMLMAYVLFAVGLSLSGVFSVGASIMGLGHGLASRSGYMGEFFTGVLATVMATPCTAPFMATAVSVALVQPIAVAIAILLTLGFGLALPYLLISFTPSVRRFLPKPGAWMETFQQVLAFPMYGAAAWLVWVLAQQAGADGLAVALAGMILIGFAAWLQQKTQMARQFWRRVGLVGSLGAITLALTLIPVVHNTTPPTAQVTDSSSNQGLTWKPYTAQMLESLRPLSQPVFINFSASWCVTCLVNERVALNQPGVITAFQEKGVILVKADWTNRNRDITRALSNFGRSGVPLYVLYPNGLEWGQPVILPQILTPAIVQNVLKNMPERSTNTVDDGETNHEA